MSLNKNIVKIKNYHPVYMDEYKCYASLGSFRLDLRNAFKEKNSDAYFSKSPTDGLKNMGCYLFGQSGLWKGVLGMNVTGDAKENTIILYLDYRNVYDVEKVKDILRPALDYLFESKIIDGYEFIK